MLAPPSIHPQLSLLSTFLMRSHAGCSRELCILEKWEHLFLNALTNFPKSLIFVFPHRSFLRNFCAESWSSFSDPRGLKFCRLAFAPSPLQWRLAAAWTPDPLDVPLQSSDLLSRTDAQLPERVFASAVILFAEPS